MWRKYILIASTALFTFSSCLDLDVENPSTISDNDVWNDPKLIQMYVNHLYINYPDGIIERITIYRMKREIITPEVLQRVF